MMYTAVLAAFAAVAAAQSVTSTAGSSSSTASSCEAQNILDACKATIQGQINNCAANDWSCLCESYGNMLTCYNNCPNDVGVTTVQQQRDQNCIAASAYGTSTSTGPRGSATATATTSTSSEESAQTGFASATDSASTSASTSSEGGAASVQIGANLVFFAGAAAYMFL